MSKWRPFKKGLSAYHDWKTRRKVDRVFQRGEDPYGYWSHSHEREKQDIIESLVNGIDCMRLVKEFVAGTDPKKSKYLASLLEKIAVPDLHKTLFGLRSTLCALQVFGSMALVGCRGVWSPNIVHPTEIKNFQEAKVQNSRSEKHKNYLRENLSPQPMSDQKRAKLEEKLRKLREKKK